LVHSSEFQQQLCSLFNIEDLADVIKVLVDVDNEQPAPELLEFYTHSVDIIQSFLLTNAFLSETRSTDLQAIFFDINFVLVDHIRLSYRYRDDILRTAPSSSILDSYIDESTRKFYILKKYEKSESRHIDTMVNYLSSDESARLKLSQYIRHLFRIYQDEGIEGLINKKADLPEQSVSKWVITQMIKKEATSSLVDDDEEDTVSNEPIDIPLEMIEKKKSEPGWQLPKPNPNAVIDPNELKPLTCFPATAGAIGSVASSSPKPPLNSQTQLTNEFKETVATSSESLIDAKNNPPSGTSVPSSSVSGTNDGTRIDGKHGDGQSSDRSTRPHNTPITIADFTLTSPRANFEHIRISTLTDLVLSPTSLSNVPNAVTATTSSNEVDILVGRRGEEYVYEYLQWKYPDAQIQWFNKDQEFGQPFDIQIIRKVANIQQTELIEVKTTRSAVQNTFHISVGEVECLLENQTNYYIYRVYLANDEKLSTITILSRLKCHLQQKQLALSMTIVEKLNEQ
jgi:hypothetical protein